MHKAYKWKKNTLAVGFGLIGPLAILLSVVGLNKLLVENEDDKEVKVTNFAVQKTQKKQKFEKKVKPKPKKSKPKQDFRPNLDSVLAGSSFGLESFEWLDQDALGGDILDQMKDAAMTAETVEQAPVVMKTAPLDYPKIARKQGIKGYVTLNLLVAPNGSVEKTQIISSVPSGIFDRVATDSVKLWKFQPGQNKGQKVAVWVEQTIKFALN
ncbi:MAG: energy transducer TonB [Pseudobacteriovorax sp.]|nr:energy transducer TonB [Pseudobacteriovorax sp.]